MIEGLYPREEWRQRLTVRRRGLLEEKETKLRDRRQNPRATELTQLADKADILIDAGLPKWLSIPVAQARREKMRICDFVTTSLIARRCRKSKIRSWGA